MSCDYLRTDYYYDFTVHKNRNYELCGIVHHNSGKSTATAAMIAATALDRPITCYDGRKISFRRKEEKGRPLVIFCVGLQINHLGTMHGMLFRPGLYKIIRDRDTGLWRAWAPWYKDDAERIHECKPSWPLIPPSEVDEKRCTYHNKAARQFELMTLKNGTEFWGHASTALRPKMGDKVHRIWIDEELATHSHYEEFLMRTVSNRGKIFYSAYTNDANETLIDITNRAEEQAEEVEKGLRDHVDVAAFHFTFSGNPYIHEDEKRRIQEAMSEDALLARDQGKFGFQSRRIYHTFSPSIHTAIPDEPRLDDKVAAALRANNMVPPANWTHDLVLDPGTAKPAVIFAAVPPPELWGGDHPVIVVYQEIYGRRMTAADIAEEIHRLKPPGVWFRRFIIDDQAGRAQREGYLNTVKGNYSEYFKKFHLESVETGSGFVPGDPNFHSRRMLVEAALAMRPDGRPRLRFVLPNCRATVQQMERNFLQVTDGYVQDKPASRQRDDCRMAVEYLLSRHPTYVPLPEHIIAPADRYEQAMQWLDEMYGGPKRQQGVVIGPAA